MRFAMIEIRRCPLFTRSAFLVICYLMITLLSCKDKEESPTHITHEPDPSVVKTLLFEKGSWWAFADSLTTKTDTLMITSVFAGYKDSYAGSNVLNTRYSYEANLYQTSTKRKYLVMYSSLSNSNIKDYSPRVTLLAYNNYFGEGYEHIIFNTNIGDTLLGGFAFPSDTQYFSSRFILLEKGLGIKILATDYNEPYYKMKILNSVAYDRKDLELWLIENIGFGHHNMGGNYFLVDHSATNIVP